MAVPRSLMSPDPRARPAASVTVDRVRVTVLTPRLLRLEHAADRQFEDRGSTAVVNRRFTVPDFEVREHAGGFVLDTGEVTLTVTDASRPLTRSTTSARIGRGRQSVTWRPGDRARTNLGGTARTLDNCRGREVRELVDLDPDGELVFSDWTRWDLDPGLLSRDGWVVLDDSTSPVFDPDAGRPEPARGRGWPTARPAGRRQDLYLFAHGTDHRGALADAAALIGPQPLPPRYAFGYWYSRYWAYTDRDLLDIAERFDTMDVPVDVMVIDMDWHLPGWTGYSWDRRYFPDPTDTLDRLHRRGLRVTLNVHPADGVGPHEDRYPEMARAVGLDPASGERIPFAVTDPEFIEAYFRFLHHPEEDRGVDFWWMDWQQGTTSAVEGLDPLPWLNELHWSDQQSRRPDRRPLVFSRWGGMGGGRYPIGFSGDTWSTWDSLALQPWFTATAANVGYGFWSHDIGGHTGEPPSPELYTRWMQFGAFSPVLRTHATKDPAQDRRFWEFADPHRSVMIRAVHRRYELVPYLYGQCRRAVDTGVSALRPMYHDHPDRDAAYVADGQYLLGDDLVVAPVVTPLEDDRMAPVRVWLPRGRWYDTALGQTVTVRGREGEWFEHRYLLDEVPVFAAAGAVIAGQRDARRLDAPCYPHPVITAYPGGDGDGELYEDDGVSPDYLRGDSVTVRLRQRVTDRARSVRIGPARGDYAGWERHRPLEVRIVAEAVPRSVEVDGRALPMATAPDGAGIRAGRGYWYHDTTAASVVVRMPRIDLRATTTVRLVRDRDRPRSIDRMLDGYPGLARRLDAVAERVGEVSAGYELHPEERLAVDLAQAASRVTRDPTTLAAEVRRARSSLGHLETVLAEFQTAWGRAIALPFPEQRIQAVAVVAEARAILATTRSQFG